MQTDKQQHGSGSAESLLGEKQLQTLLVHMGYNPDTVAHDTTHDIEHLLHILSPDDEDALVSYYGLFGTERASLAEIAREREVSPEDMIATIDGCIRKIAVTPEWQIIRRKI